MTSELGPMTKGAFIGGILLLLLLFIHFVIADARAKAANERDLYWQAEIEKSNAAATAKVAEQRSFALAAEANAQSEILSLANKLHRMEKANAAISDDHRCALGAARVRLLNKAVTRD